MFEGEIVGTIDLEPPALGTVRPLEQCKGCGRFIVGSCSVCPPPAPPEQPELTSADESEAAFVRERELLKRKERDRA